MNRASFNRARATIAAGVLTASIGLAACGSSESDSTPGETAAAAPSYERALAKAPPELAELYANGSELIEGGQEAYDATIAGVGGYPVVVNVWGSWCGPCREEFPYLQSQAAEHLDEVAFLGIDVEDSPDAYATFLEENPVPYPSVADPEREFGKWTDTALVGQPNTLFYDAEGRLLYAKQGPYSSEAELAADIDTYALDV